MECSENPNFISVIESEYKGPERGIRRDLIINPFFYMMLVPVCQTTYALLTDKKKNDLKGCPNCGTENNRTAKYCSDCGTSLKS